MIYGVIYLIINRLTGKMYVGQTTQTLKARMAQHKRGNQYIDKIIQDNKRENFTVEILKVCSSKAELDAWEKFFIAALRCKVPFGYNCTDGGESGWSHLPETRAKMSETHTGTHLSEETRKKIAVAQIGNKNGLGHCPTDEARAKMSAANKGVPKSIEQRAKSSETKRKESPFKNLLKAITERQLTYRSLAKLMGMRHQSISRKMRGIRCFTEAEWAKLSEILNLPVEYLMQRDDGQSSLPKSRCGENNPFFGKHHKKETKDKLSEMNSGQNNPNFGIPRTDEQRAKIGAGNRGKKRTTEMRAKVSATKRGETPYKNLSREITQRQLTYTALAKLMGMAPNTFSRKMTCKRNFTAQDIAKLVEIFGCSAEYLMARDDT